MFTNFENVVLQPGAASGGSESWKTKCFNRVLPPACQNLGKVLIIYVLCTCYGVFRYR